MAELVEGRIEWHSEDGRLEKLDESNRQYGAYDKHNSPICYDVKSAWEYLDNIKT